METKRINEEKAKARAEKLKHDLMEQIHKGVSLKPAAQAKKEEKSNKWASDSSAAAGTVSFHSHCVDVSCRII
jgi:hypothetical protein